jgi:hypothetical protein
MLIFGDLKKTEEFSLRKDIFSFFFDNSKVHDRKKGNTLACKPPCYFFEI